MKNWFVVANASRARVLEEAEPGGSPPSRSSAPYRHVADLVHPQSRQKGTELATDRPGRVDSGPHGQGSAAYEAKTDPHEREHQRFALEVARVVDAGVADGRCAGLVLVASNPFLGHLKARIGEQSRKAVLRTVVADFTTLGDRELAERLAGTGDAA